MTSIHLNAYDLGLYLSQQEDASFVSDDFDDEDYGYADDGWPIPPPCIIDGTPMNACTHDWHAERARLQLQLSNEG